MALPFVSVVIPASNAAAWISESIQSVVGQSYERSLLEVVVVDDGSSDGTGTVATGGLRAPGLGITVLRNETPLGPAAARNRGWRIARGEWIQFLDADDLLAPCKIETQALATIDAPENVAVVFSPWSYSSWTPDGWSAEAEVVEPAIGADPLMDVLRADNFIATGSQMFSRRWLEHVNGYVEAYRLIEDVDLLMRIVINGGVLQRVPSHEALFWYRRRAGSESRVNRRAFVESQIRNTGAAESHWRSTAALTPARASFLAGLYFDAARFLAEHDRRAFETLVTRIYALHPGFVPPRPFSLRLLTQLVGYRRAEQAAVGYRRLKRLAGDRAPDLY